MYGRLTERKYRRAQGELDLLATQGERMPPKERDSLEGGACHGNGSKQEGFRKELGNTTVAVETASGGTTEGLFPVLKNPRRRF